MDGVTALAVSEAYYVTIYGLSAVVVSDATGRSTSPTNTVTGTVPGTVPGVTILDLDDTGSLLVLAAANTYTVTFSTAGESVSVEINKGTPGAVTQMIRYRDVTAAAGISATLTFAPGNVSSLRLDPLRNGSFNLPVSPTAAAAGTSVDWQAPVIVVSITQAAQLSVATITATDAGSGVARLLYSVDGRTFQSYAGPITADERYAVTVRVRRRPQREPVRRADVRPGERVLQLRSGRAQRLPQRLVAMRFRYRLFTGPVTFAGVIPGTCGSIRETRGTSPCCSLRLEIRRTSVESSPLGRPESLERPFAGGWRSEAHPRGSTLRRLSRGPTPSLNGRLWLQISPLGIQPPEQPGYATSEPGASREAVWLERSRRMPGFRSDRPPGRRPRGAAAAGRRRAARVTRCRRPG